MDSFNTMYNMPLTSIDADAVKLPSTKVVKKKQEVEEKKKIGKGMQELYDAMGGNCYDIKYQNLK